MCIAYTAQCFIWAVPRASHACMIPALDVTEPFAESWQAMLHVANAGDKDSSPSRAEGSSRGSEHQQPETEGLALRDSSASATSSGGLGSNAASTSQPTDLANAGMHSPQQAVTGSAFSAFMSPVGKAAGKLLVTCSLAVLIIIISVSKCSTACLRLLSLCCWTQAVDYFTGVTSVMPQSTKTPLTSCLQAVELSKLLVKHFGPLLTWPSACGNMDATTCQAAVMLHFAGAKAPAGYHAPPTGSLPQSCAFLQQAGLNAEKPGHCILQEFLRKALRLAANRVHDLCNRIDIEDAHRQETETQVGMQSEYHKHYLKPVCMCRCHTSWSTLQLHVPTVSSQELLRYHLLFHSST